MYEDHILEQQISQDLFDKIKPQNTGHIQYERYKKEWGNTVDNVLCLRRYKNKGEKFENLYVVRYGGYAIYNDNKENFHYAIEHRPDQYYRLWARIGDYFLDTWYDASGNPYREHGFTFDDTWPDKQELINAVENEEIVVKSLDARDAMVNPTNTTLWALFPGEREYWEERKRLISSK